MTHQTAIAAVQMALFTDPKYMRVFYRVEVDLTVWFLDNHDLPTWQSWAVGQTLHWHPYKVTLEDTKRAGRHIVTRWRANDGTMRYAANAPVVEPGIYVLSPGQVIDPSALIEKAENNPFERSLTVQILRERFNVDCGLTARACDVLQQIPLHTISD